MTKLETDPTGLTRLIAEIRDSYEDDDLLVEHLESARVYLVVGMPEEGALSLELAEDAAGAMRDESLRHRAQEQILNLLTEVRRHG